MDQPTNETFAGFKHATIVAAFLGSAISLSYAKDLTKKQAAVAFLAGGATAIYAAPLLLHYADLSGDNIERAVAFCTGLAAMRAVPALLALVDRLRDIKLPWIG
jgi:hypothetical protein